jgi:hypothetical protein
MVVEACNIVIVVFNFEVPLCIVVFQMLNYGFFCGVRGGAVG